MKFRSSPADSAPLKVWRTTRHERWPPSLTSMICVYWKLKTSAIGFDSKPNKHFLQVPQPWVRPPPYLGIQEFVSAQKLEKNRVQNGPRHQFVSRDPYLHLYIYRTCFSPVTHLHSAIYRVFYIILYSLVKEIHKFFVPVAAGWPSRWDQCALKAAIGYGL